MQSPQEKAFLTEIDANQGIIRKVAHLYADRREDREDLYQEIVYQSWKAFPAFKGEAKFSTWLYRVSLNTALTFRKQESKRKPTRDLLPEDAIEDPRPPQEAREILLWAIRKLDKIDRMIILLHLDGYENKEIADITGLSTNNLAVKLHRTKAKLTATIRKEEQWN